MAQYTQDDSQSDNWWTQNDPPPAPINATASPDGVTPAASATGTPGANVTIDQLKQIIGNDWSPGHLQQVLPQLKALGIEVQNQARGDLRPRFLLPGGEQWDFGPGGWINSGHGVAPGFGAGPGGGGGPAAPGGGGPGSPNMADALSTLRDTPGYQFAYQQGLDAIQKSAFAKGTGLTGGTLKALQQYGTGLADQLYNQQFHNYLDFSKLGYPQQPS